MPRSITGAGRMPPGFRFWMSVEVVFFCWTIGEREEPRASTHTW